MKVISQLEIDDKDSLIILVPELEKKYNYFYKPTELLHIYDQISIYLYQRERKIKLAQDMFDNSLQNILDVLKSIKSGNSILAKEIQPGKLGALYNQEIMFNVEDFYDVSTFYVCKYMSKIITFMYIKNDKIYLEIAPLYSQLYKEFEDAKQIILFEEYMKTYQPIALYQLDKEVVERWLIECERIVGNTDKSTIHSQG